MKNTDSLDNDADDEQAPEFHAKAMARHEALAAKHRAMADHHRQMHGTALDQGPRAGLLKAANRMGSGY